MKKNNLLLVFILMTFFTKGMAQKKYELGKVTIEELNEKAHPRDSSAAAAILFRKGKTSFTYEESGFFIVTEVDTKIKIYKKTALKYADFSVDLYIGGQTKEVVTFSKAVTYNLVGGKIEKSKLKSEGQFEEKINKFSARKKITMPNVKEGSIIEYSYELKTPYIGNFPDWQFQTSIPVDYSEYRTLIPEYYVYNVRTKGTIVPAKTEEVGKRSATVFDRGNILTGINNSLTQTYEFDEKRTTYKLDNIPALSDESYVNNINNYTSSISHELASTQYPGDVFKTYASTWESVVKNIYDNESFGGELDKKSYFESDINPLVFSLTTNNDKIAAIFNFVKNRMNWNEYNSYYCDEGVKTAYKNKTGNSAEINLMLVAMLRHVGINANPILVSTRNHGIALFPSRSAYNHVICGVTTDEENGLIVLDATNKYAMPNILPIRDLNWFGRMIMRDGRSLEVNLTPRFSSKEIVNLTATMDAQGKITGNIRDQYLDYNAYVYRSRFNSVAKDSYIEKLEKDHIGIEIGEYEKLNELDLSKPIIENYSFSHNNVAEIIGDKMYFSPLLYLATTKNPFTQESREYPVDMIFPNQEKYYISITIPDGYTIETLPKSKALAMIDNLAIFKYNISNTDKQIQLLFTFDINQAIIPSNYYLALKDFYREMIEKEMDKIVLKKI